jgi:branched-chain amino acid transport system substrate-binding protein
VIFSGKRPLARVVVAVAGATALLAACGGGSKGGSTAGSGSSGGGGSDTGITATTIKVGTHMPLTGVAAPGYSEIPVGAKAYFDYLNDQGGINGRKIEYVVKDDGYNPTNTSSVTNGLVLQDKVFGMLQGLGTPTHSAVLDFLNEQEVPDLFVSSGALAWNQPEKYPETFGWQPDYTVEGKILGKYIKENFPTAKVGLFLQGDDLGRDGAAGVKQFIGDQVVKEVTYTSGNTDVAPQISQLKASGADLIVGFNVPAYTALSQLVSLGLNYKPKWMFSSVALDPQLVGGLLAKFSKGKVTGASVLEGFYVTSYLGGTTDTDSPWVQLWQKVWAAKGDGKPLTNFEIYGMAGAFTFAQTLAAAGKDVTRKNIVTTLEEKGGSFQGPGLAPFAYAKDSHRGISGAKIVQLKGGKPVDVTKVQTTGDGDTPIQDAPASTATPPANGIPTG